MREGLQVIHVKIIHLQKQNIKDSIVNLLADVHVISLGPKPLSLASLTIMYGRFPFSSNR